jgi:hypothetical protein
VTHPSWGQGWPTNRIDDMRPLVVGGASFPAGMHFELVELWELLLAECEERGYDLVPGWCWGYAGRYVKIGGVQRPDLGPSNHSYGTAGDINAPANAQGGTKTDMPPWMPQLFDDYGFDWGLHFPTPDPMHYEFSGSVADARRLTEKARRDLVGLTDDQKALLNYVRGLKAHADGKPKPPEAGPKRDGWTDAKRSLQPPEHESPGE